MISMRFIFLALAFSTFGAMATPSSSVSVGSLQGAATVVSVGNLQSRSGESALDFVRRAASFLSDYTAKTGFEGCGQIWRSADGATLEIPLTSNEAHIHCVVTNKPVYGFTATGVSLHSHPNGGQQSFRVNANDRYFMGSRVKIHSVQRSAGAAFSKADLKAGSDFLATEGRLMYNGGAEGIVEDCFAGGSEGNPACIPPFAR